MKTEKEIKDFFEKVEAIQMDILYFHREKDPKFTASVQSYLKTLEMERWSAKS